MLPFLQKKKQAAGVSMVYRKPDASPEAMSEQDAGLEAAADDLMRGIHSHDKKLVITAIKALLELIESEPQTEEMYEPSSER